MRQSSEAYLAEEQLDETQPGAGDDLDWPHDALTRVIDDCARFKPQPIQVELADLKIAVQGPAK